MTFTTFLHDAVIFMRSSVLILYGSFLKARYTVLVHFYGSRRHNVLNYKKNSKFSFLLFFSYWKSWFVSILLVTI